MARILYLHGSQPGSFGDKTEDWTRSGTATKPSDASAGPTQDTQPASRGGSSLHHRRWLRGAVARWTGSATTPACRTASSGPAWAWAWAARICPPRELGRLQIAEESHQARILPPGLARAKICHLTAR